MKTNTKNLPCCLGPNAEPVRRHAWRVRKENRDGSFSVAIYTMRLPVTAKSVADLPSVREWLRGSKLFAVLPYSMPETEPNSRISDTQQNERSIQ